MASLISKYEGKIDVFEYALTGRILLTKNNVIREADLTACQIFNIRMPDLLAHKIIEFIAEESRDEFSWCIHNVLCSRSGRKCEVTVRRPDGENLRAGIQLAWDPEGIEVNIWDISWQKGAVEELMVGNYNIASFVSGIIYH